MSKLQRVDIDALDSNPFRRMDTYPFVERKLDALMRSIKQVGFWEGIIVREHGNRFQLAFGHHRLEAARRSSLKTIPVILRDLTDEQMLQFMGHENNEDYRAYFLPQLETWDAAVVYSNLNPPKSRTVRAIDIAKLLGWVQPRTGGGAPICTAAAHACAQAHRLISEGHMERKDLTDLNVKSAGDICSRVAHRMKQADSMLDPENKAYPPIESPEDLRNREKAVAEIKTGIAESGKQAAKAVRSGAVAPSQVANLADSFAIDQKAIRRDPRLLHDILRDMTKGIEKVLKGDERGKRINELSKLLSDPVFVRDSVNGELRVALEDLQYALTILSRRALMKRNKLDVSKDNVVKLIVSGE